MSDRAIYEIRKKEIRKKVKDRKFEENKDELYIRRVLGRESESDAYSDNFYSIPELADIVQRYRIYEDTFISTYNKGIEEVRKKTRDAEEYDNVRIRFTSIHKNPGRYIKIQDWEPRLQHERRVDYVLACIDGYTEDYIIRSELDVLCDRSIKYISRSCYRISSSS